MNPVRIEMSLGRWKGPCRLCPSLVQLSPGWWRFELGRLAIEVDDQSAASRWRRPLLLAAVVVVGGTLK